MTDHSIDYTTTWNEVVAEILTQANRPESSIPTLNYAQQVFLKLASPMLIVDGYMVLSVPDNHAKSVIENELSAHITSVMAQRTGQPCTLAVTTSRADSTPAPAQPAQTAHTVQAPHPAPPAAPNSRPASPRPTDPSPQPAPRGRTPQPIEDPIPPRGPYQPGEQLPMNLEELAEQHRNQQEQRRRTAHPTAPAPQRIPREKPAHDPNRETSLNPKYTFESFVIGSSNRFANGAAVAVAEAPARAYNPLFIWGGSGLGKTHLLHAAGNYAKELQPGLRVKYVSSEEFTNDYINSVRDDRQEAFKRRYRNLDILMVDDIQFLEGKEGTQEEFFHTFNALHQADKQIILSSDRPPKELTTLEDRLRTRFEGGLITDIQPPDLETRIAILEKKAAADGNQVDRRVLEMIASHFDTSVRELEGNLLRVTAYASLANLPVTVEVAEVALRDLLSGDDNVEITPALIKEAVADYFHLDIDTLIGKGRKRQEVHPRQLAMYLCRELTELSLPKIGQEFGGRDHTTVMYSHTKITQEMTENHETYDEVHHLTQMIKNHRR
ncbi:chromosomal replication initiator protein DnaA [Corynebacterium uterequi]|uniref:Chromosomal replication initiator protein DnaA n=1 Tax=Corynebacterium uterequi TaxID=1072256 RepID=A0A0G3H9N4_9CORY|nr:chromosomal replication initiator protein DnaA [Corynebacterium uterequi]AKK10034.1 chromosomal replication initiator protein DnaA [Corynebacterium uterequi]